jgi:hypothetical protein
VRHHLPRSHLSSSRLTRLARPGRRLFEQASCGTPQRFTPDGRVPPCHTEQGGPCHGRTPSSASRRFEKQAISARGSPPVPISPQAPGCNLGRGYSERCRRPEVRNAQHRTGAHHPPQHRSRASNTTSETTRPSSPRNSCFWSTSSCEDARRRAIKASAATPQHRDPPGPPNTRCRWTPKHGFRNARGRAPLWCF